jgi:hypothetical protein
MWLGEPSNDPSSYVMSTVDPANESELTTVKYKEDASRVNERSKEGYPWKEKDPLKRMERRRM